MDLQYCLGQLSANAKVVKQILEGIPDDQAVWKPSAEEWSILEVVNHLIDEEKEDFRFRLNHLLSGNASPWPSNRPQKWVYDRKYNQRDLHVSIKSFMDERSASVEWLSGQENCDLTIQYKRPPLDDFSAGDLLSSWVAHDLLHLRQIVELKWKYTTIQTEPYSNEYAGEW
jgi:hypothetical protein